MLDFCQKDWDHDFTIDWNIVQSGHKTDCVGLLASALSHTILVYLLTKKFISQDSFKVHVLIVLILTRKAFAFVL